MVGIDLVLVLVVKFCIVRVTKQDQTEVLMFYIGLIVGLIIGANVGVIFSLMLVYAKIEEEMLFLNRIALKTDRQSEG